MKVKKRGAEYNSSVIKALDELDSVIDSLGPYGLNTMIGKVLRQL